MLEPSFEDREGVGVVCKRYGDIKSALPIVYHLVIRISISMVGRCGWGVDLTDGNVIYEFRDTPKILPMSSWMVRPS